MEGGGDKKISSCTDSRATIGGAKGAVWVSGGGAGQVPLMVPRMICFSKLF